MNNLTIAGNVGNVRGPNDVGDNRVLNFSLAVNEGRDKTTWFDCAVWGKRADALAPYIAKGTKLCVSGSVSADSYEGKGQLRVFVRELTFMSSRAESQERPEQPQPRTPADVGGDEFDDSIPFAQHERGMWA